MFDSITDHYGRRVGVLVLLALGTTLAFVAIFGAHVAAVGTGEAGLAALSATAVVVTLNLGLLGIVLVGNVGVDLRRLTAVAEAVRDGDFEASADSDRPDEIGRLFGAVDEMRRSLRDAVAESERAQADAEAAREEAEALTDDLLDHAEGIGSAMEDAADGDVLNIRSSDNISIQKLAETVRDQLAPELEIVYESAREADAEHTRASAEKAGELIGCEPLRTITEGVGEFIEWYQANREWYEPLVRSSISRESRSSGLSQRRRWRPCTY